MADASFGRTAAANRKKKELKDKLAFQRVPLLDFEVMNDYKDKNISHNKLNRGLTKLLNICVVCGAAKRPCEVGCPIQYKKSVEDLNSRDLLNSKWHLPSSLFGMLYATQFNTSTVPEFEDEFHKNELRFATSITKIRERSDYNFQVINQWKKDRSSITPVPSLEYYKKVKSISFTKAKDKSFKLKALAHSVGYMLPWISENYEKVKNKCSDKVCKVRKTPPHLLPMGEWSRMKRRLEKVASRLQRDSIFKRKKSMGSPNDVMVCQHATEVKERSLSITKALASQPVRPKKKLSVSWSGHNNSKFYESRTPQNSSFLKRISLPPIPSHSKSISKSGIEAHKERSKSVLFSEPLVEGLAQKALLPKLPPVIILVTEAVGSKVANYNLGNKKSLKQKSRKIIEIKDGDFCESCHSIPCLQLKACAFVKWKTAGQAVKSHAAARAKPFEYILGIERVSILYTRIGRVERNKTLGFALKLHPKYCKGNGKCNACKEDLFYSRKMAVHQHRLMEHSR